MKLNILVLHNLGDPSTWRESMVEKELCLPRFAPEHNYVVHEALLPLPSYVREMHFDGILLTQTFLSKRADPVLFPMFLRNYAFVRDSTAFKIALPQDDYTCHAVLDRWMVDWKVDLLFPACINDWKIFYPLYAAVGRMRQGYTGYISRNLIERSATVKPISERDLDVTYRAARLAPEFGRLGMIKSEIGKRFEQAARERGMDLKLDLSTRSKDAVVGTKWYDFIANSKCMLGVNSGASLLDPEGSISLSVHAHLQLRPAASFEEVEAACFPGQDGLEDYTGISPRNMECALLGTVQILTPGPYGNFLSPWKHYLPIEPDMSNFDAVAERLGDIPYLQSMANACRDEILSHPELRYENHVEDLLAEIRGGSTLSGPDRQSSAPLFDRYRADSGPQDHFWKRRRARARLRETFARLGLRRAKYFLRRLFGRH
jgi:hypothetical protein